MHFHKYHRTYPEHDIDVLAVLTPDLLDVPLHPRHELEDDVGTDGGGGHDGVDRAAKEGNERQGLRKRVQRRCNNSKLFIYFWVMTSGTKVDC